MPRFRDADGRNDVTLFKILPDPPLSNEVARGEKKMKGERKKRRKRRERERTMRREREKTRGSRSYCNNMKVCHEKFEKNYPTEYVNQRYCYCFCSTIVSSRMLLSNFSLFIGRMTTMKYISKLFVRTIREE